MKSQPGRRSSSRELFEEGQPPMKLGLILSQTARETVFNALRLANYSLKQGDSVKIFLIGKAVELDGINDPKFKVQEEARMVLDGGGQFLALWHLPQLT
jgi:hypothetical protein